MSNDFNIKKLEVSDIADLVRICNQTFLEGARLPNVGLTISRGLEKFPEWQFGAFQDKELAGFVLGLPRPEKDRVHLRLIGVDPDFKGQGLGSRLIEEFEKFAREQNFSIIDLGTPYARTFYEKNGFTCAHVNLKMIKGLIARTISPPAGLKLESLDYENIPEILQALSSDKPYSFLNTFFRHYSSYSGLFTLIRKAGCLAGIVLGKINDRYADMGQALYYKAFKDGTISDLTAAFEYTLSKQGLKQIGFSISEEEQAEFEAYGYEISKHDYFWTHYTMEKEL